MSFTYLCLFKDRLIAAAKCTTTVIYFSHSSFVVFGFFFTV